MPKDCLKYDLEPGVSLENQALMYGFRHSRPVIFEEEGHKVDFLGQVFWGILLFWVERELRILGIGYELEERHGTGVTWLFVALFLALRSKFHIKRLSHWSWTNWGEELHAASVAAGTFACPIWDALHFLVSEVFKSSLSSEQPVRPLDEFISLRFLFCGFTVSLVAGAVVVLSLLFVVDLSVF